MPTPSYWQIVAGQVRAELARQALSVSDLANVIDKSLPTARDRLAGRSAFDLVEIELVADWLKIELDALLVAA